jgi:hypothetical protein
MESGAFQIITPVEKRLLEKVNLLVRGLGNSGIDLPQALITQDVQVYNFGFISCGILLTAKLIA